ncbi:MAG: hypothetical protein WEE66_02015 [Actinomycetota bacterium]
MASTSEDLFAAIESGEVERVRSMIAADPRSRLHATRKASRL